MSLKTKTLSLLGVTTLVFSVGACGLIGGAAEGPASEDRPMSPLNQIMDQVWGTNLSQEEQQRQLDEQALRREEYTAQCMNDLGFEYNINPNSGGTIVTSDTVEWRPDDREWVAEWGYGAVNSPWNAHWEAEQAAREESGEPEQWFDPNQEIWENMTDAQAQAWQRALWSPWDELPEGIVSEDGQILDMDAFDANRGCSGWAWTQVSGDDAWNLMNTDEFRPLMEAMNDLWGNVTANPQWAAIDREWASCMADAGHPGFNQQGDAQNSIWDESSEIQNTIDWDNWNWDNGQPNARTVPALAALADREVALALADLDCRVSVNLRDRQEALQFAAENQFINDHRAALDALIAAVEQGR